MGFVDMGFADMGFVARHPRTAGFAAVLATATLTAVLVATLAPVAARSGSGQAQHKASVEDLLSAVVRVKTYINPDARTIENLGREREGSGVVIDEDGLVLTIGHLMVEAHAAEISASGGRTVPAIVVGYDHDSGFGLLRALEPLRVRPMPMGKSDTLKEHDPALVASHGGRGMLGAVRVVSRRDYAGGWEYLLEDAIFTSPPHPDWSGAALINREGKLVGVGSLAVRDAAKPNGIAPGNMFVPIDRLRPVLADLLANGRPSTPPRPWLGMSSEEVSGRILVSGVTPGGPADKAGLKRGDIIAGVDGSRIRTLPELYRKIWARGRAGVVVPLDVMQDDAVRRVEVLSMDRLDHLKLKSTF